MITVLRDHFAGLGEPRWFRELPIDPDLRPMVRSRVRGQMYLDRRRRRSERTPEEEAARLRRQRDTRRWPWRLAFLAAALLGPWSIWYGPRIAMGSPLFLPLLALQAGLLILGFILLQRSRAPYFVDALRAYGVIVCPHCGHLNDGSPETLTCPECGRKDHVPRPEPDAFDHR